MRTLSFINAARNADVVDSLVLSRASAKRHLIRLSAQAFGAQTMWLWRTSRWFARLPLRVGLIVCVASYSAARAEQRNEISFQGVLNQSNGARLANGIYNLTFRFYASPTTNGTVNGNAVIATNGVAVTEGVVNTAIPVQPDWFDGQTRYLGISINGGSEFSPRVMITAVPYAHAAGTLYPDPVFGDPRIVGTLRVSKGIWVESAELNSFSYVGRFHQGYYSDWNGTGKEAEFYRLIGQGDPHSGFGAAIGQEIASPVVWMYGQAGNAFKVVKVGFGQAVRDGDELFAVHASGVTSCKVLKITGGADLAEHLSVIDTKPDDEFQVKPGMLVSIDPTGNRKFKLSDEPYDRRRVGVISGGNGVQPGLVLRDAGNLIADGEQPIALTGQVWCHADANLCSITPGDLLTTSSTPGHAMKVLDDAKARFAVLGQAITGLKAGRGWVQVLVRCQ